MAKPLHKSKVIDLLEERAVVRMRDFLAAGIPSNTVLRMAERGEIDGHVRGVYTLPGAFNDQTRTVAAAFRTPKAVVCLLSAASVHGLVTANPGRVWLAIPWGAWRPRVRDDGAPPMAVVRMAPYLVESGCDADIGVEERDFGHGQTARITGPARTVADLFRYAGCEVAMSDGTKEAPITTDLAVEALQTALANGTDAAEVRQWAGLVGSGRAVEAALAGGRAMRW